MDLGIEGLGEATQIGVGGSATVYRARQSKLDRDVAVKVLTVDDPDFVRRFEREARTLGKLSQNPGIVTVYDTGITASGKPYLVLELCPSSLQDRLQEEGTLQPGEASRLLARVAASVDAAHQQGVVHRDLKPGNILLSSSGEPLVTDFGIAVVADTTMGQTAAVGFTPGYVAPETVKGGRPGEAADVYALGATLFQSLTGTLPFDDGEGNSNLLALAKRVSNEPLPDLRDAGVPDALCRVLEAAMAKNPDDRPSAGTLRDWLHTVSLGGVPQIPTPTPAGPATDAPRPPSTNPTHRIPTPPSRPGGSFPNLDQPPPPRPGDRYHYPSSGRPGPAVAPASNPSARPATPNRPNTQGPAAPPRTPMPHPVGAPPSGSGPVRTPPPRQQTPAPPNSGPRRARPSGRRRAEPHPGPRAQRPLPATPPPVAPPRAGSPRRRRREKRPSLFLRFMLFLARGTIAAIVTAAIGVVLFLIGMDVNSSSFEFDPNQDLVAQAGEIGAIGAFMFVIGPFVVFFPGAFLFPWPKVRR